MNTIGADVDELDALGGARPREPRARSDRGGHRRHRAQLVAGPERDEIRGGLAPCACRDLRTVADLLEHAAHDLQAQGATAAHHQ